MYIFGSVCAHQVNNNNNHDTTHSQMLGKVESGGGPIFKVVLEC